MTLYVTKRETPIGEVVARRSERGLVSMGFSDRATDAPAGRVDPDPAVGDAIDRYFAGSTEALDELAVDVEGTALQRRIWRLLRGIHRVRRDPTESSARRSAPRVVSSATRWPLTRCAWPFPATV